MTDTVEMLEARLVLLAIDSVTLRLVLAAEIELGKRRLTEIEALKREIAALKIRTATTTDQ